MIQRCKQLVRKQERHRAILKFFAILEDGFNKNRSWNMRLAQVQQQVSPAIVDTFSTASQGAELTHLLLKHLLNNYCWQIVEVHLWIQYINCFEKKNWNIYKYKCVYIYIDISLVAGGSYPRCS